MLPSSPATLFSLHPPGKTIGRSCNANKREKERLTSVLDRIAKSEDKAIRNMSKSISSLQASLDKVSISGNSDISLDGFESKSAPTTPKRRRNLKSSETSLFSFDDDFPEHKNRLPTSRSLHNIPTTNSVLIDDALLKQGCRRRRGHHNSLPSIFDTGSMSAPSSPKTPPSIKQLQTTDRLSSPHQHTFTHPTTGQTINHRRSSDAHKTISQIVDSYRDLSSTHQGKSIGKSNHTHKFRRFSLGTTGEHDIKPIIPNQDRKMTNTNYKIKKKIGYEPNIDMENAVYDPKIPKHKSKFAKRS
ncbi:uncharacterized protein TRIADDRAFT_52599 [Trichoplax adhaerens]|uniref:Uncharacterized protein n=1 Tax=Trichoplax adhaerens TaxID=10228 RepID=B3RJE8_TRIAD|nr:hypothetical protein TRIADDRAFT_52599 [Trichoplax adhaerens]EDV29811.1 hypothetical protein TRIADDRAFT_52599 [Trichoplax adhaerens]|eukprot:XP_002109013.1 hypothetical protein TRIADDRAFT_52599 [Trichoplax adhaerens]